MSRNKHLWQRLQSLEEEYSALLQTDHPVYREFFEYSLRALSREGDRKTDRLHNMHKEITALRARFGIEQMPDPPVAPPRPRVMVHRLPLGLKHPVTPQDVNQVLDMLPAWDLFGLRSVILTDRRWDRHACYGRRRIKLCYPVDACYRVRLHRNEGWWEVCRFGAWVEEEGDARYVCWEPEDLKNYVLRHLLLHEIGHHVALLRGQGWPMAATRREEAFAESYAIAHYDPGRG